MIRTYLERAKLLRSVGIGAVDFSGLDSDTINDLANLVRRYDVDDLKRFAPPKRYSMIACFLAEAQKTTLDHLVEMHREFLTGMSRRARTKLEERQREVRSAARSATVSGSRPEKSRARAPTERSSAKRSR